MISPKLLDARVVSAGTKAIVVFAILSAISVATCLALSFYSLNRINDAQAQLKKLESNLQAVRSELDAARALKKPQTPGPQEACTVFQTAVQALAQNCGATIGEFDTNPEVQAYLSKYTNDNPPEGWNQVATTFSLSGSAQSIFETLDALKSTDIAFEIDAIDLTRVFTDRTGSSTVKAQIQVRVLMRA